MCIVIGMGKDAMVGLTTTVGAYTERQGIKIATKVKLVNALVLPIRRGPSFWLRGWLSNELP